MRTPVNFPGLPVMVVILLSSCNGDDSKPTHPIVGTWKLVSDSAAGCDDPLDNYEDTYTCTSSECITITFKRNGKFIVKEIDDGDVDTETGTYSISGNEITICYDDDPMDCEGPMIFSIDGATLTLTSEVDFDNCVFTIILVK
jgi:hypothetical protein